MIKILFIISMVFPWYLTAQEDKGCIGESYAMINPFMGNWKEFTVTQEAEVYMGTLQSSKGQDKCTITQRFISADGSFSYQCFGYVDSSTSNWKEIYVFNNGNHSEYQWFKEDSDIIMRRTSGTRLLDYMHQLRLTNITKDSYDVFEEHSYDNGITWQNVELTRIKRSNP